MYKATCKKYGNKKRRHCVVYSKRYRDQNGNLRYVKTKKCGECGAEFNPSRPLQVYCGYRCSNTVSNRKASISKQCQLTCLACKKKFTKRKSDLKIYPGSQSKNRYRYCSRACWKNRDLPISALKKKAWIVFSLYIKNRDNWTCFTCGKTQIGSGMHGGHFISRRHNATLFDERNVHAQCSGCNAFKNGEPHIYAEKLINLYGKDFFMDLIAKSKETKKFTRSELLDIFNKYKDQSKPYDKPGKRGGF